MAGYLPLGKKVIINEERYITNQKLFELYDYYGIPYGVFDGDDEGTVSYIEKIRSEARRLLQEGKEINPELKAELLKYKEQDKDRFLLLNK